MTGCCCAGSLHKIAAVKEKLFPRILEELLAHEKKSRYTDKQEALFQCEILDFISRFYQRCLKITNINSFIISAGQSASPKTRKKAKSMIKEYALV